MKNESAVSETISYDTGNCSICETEVALDESVPDDVMEPKAYAAIIGEGKISKELEQEGNWDFELAFQLDETEQRHPDVSGYIICEECARNIHGHPQDAEYYYGEIPSSIAGKSMFNETSEEINNIALIIAGILLAFFLILILLF